MRDKPFDIAVISGYFNPLHVGHLDYIAAAKNLAYDLVVIVNNDKQQMLKKGRIILPEDQRVRVIRQIKGVDAVELSIDEDRSVCRTLKSLASKYAGHSIVFCNGGDQTATTIPETAACAECGITLRFGIGGEKVTSSTEINNKVEKKRALISGITGQDGHYLTELLLEKGYDIYGIVRRVSAQREPRVLDLLSKVHVLEGNLIDEASLVRAVEQAMPDEVYNLGAQSFVPNSWISPLETFDITAGGVARLLEAIRLVKPDTRFYQASSSEMFGKVHETPQSETTPFHPRSPYGCAKVYAHYLTQNYRESFGMFACSGILFNHESEIRPIQFVTRKITDGIARIKAGRDTTPLRVGNLEAKRDWGHSRDYVRAMWMMLQQKKPDDYVIATGETHTVREFVELSLQHAGIESHSNGKVGIEEKYLDSNGNVLVEVDPKFYRPAEVDLLLGDPTKAQESLGWKPYIGFNLLVQKMVGTDLKRYAAEYLPLEGTLVCGCTR